MRHIPYVPHPGWEVLTTTGRRRAPQCVRENVVVVIPPLLLQWFPFLATLKFRVEYPLFTVN